MLTYVGVYYISKNRDYYINHKVSTLENRSQYYGNYHSSLWPFKRSMHVCVCRKGGGDRKFTSLGENYLMQISLEAGDDVEQQYDKSCNLPEAFFSEAAKTVKTNKQIYSARTLVEEYFFHVQVYVYHHGHIKLTSLNSRSINSCRFSSLERCTLFFLSSSCLIYNIKCKQFLCPVLGRMQRNLRRIICSRQFMS